MSDQAVNLTATEPAPVATEVAAPETAAVEQPVVRQTRMEKAVADGDMEAYSRLMDEKEGRRKPSPESATEQEEKPPAEAKPAAKADEPKPPAESALKDKGQQELIKLRRERRELAEENARLKAATQPKPDPAPETKAKPATADPDPKPRMRDFEGEDAIDKWEDAHLAWMERQIERKSNAAIERYKAESQQAEGTKATREMQKSLDTELKDWTATVIGTTENAGILEAVDEQLVDWIAGKGEVAMRGIYQVGKLSADEQAEFLSLPIDEQVAEILSLGKQKKSTGTPQPPSAIKRQAAPPPAHANGGTGAASDPIRAAVERGDMAEYSRLMRDKENRERGS